MTSTHLRDSKIAARLHPDASPESIKYLMYHCFHSGDATHIVWFRVMTVWLNIADETQEPDSILLIEVAARSKVVLSVAHTAVHAFEQWHENLATQAGELSMIKKY